MPDQDSTATCRVFITAFEPSGDRIAADVARSLRGLAPEIRLEGIGGPAMADAGVELHEDVVARATMGLRSLLRVTEARRWLAIQKRRMGESPFALQLGVDSWTVNKHFASQARALGVKTMHVVAPQVWASRPWRVKSLGKHLDRLACILPFEPAWFERRGVRAEFIGHPLFDRLPADRPPHVPRDVGDAPIIALPCGSRRQTARQNLPRQMEVAHAIRKRFKNATFIVPTTAVTDPIVRPMLTSHTHVSAELNGFDQAIPQCDLALTVSGTATLHIAAFGVPMVVVYAASPILWHGIGRWLINTRTYAQVNLLATNDPDPPHAAHVVPEFIPWFGSTAACADACIALLEHASQRQAMTDRLNAMVASLDHRGAPANAARIAMELIG